MTDQETRRYVPVEVEKVISGEPGGFTLVELMLAVTLMVVVVGSITAVLVTATRAMTAGQENLEVYQTARAGLNRIIKDLRKSLSPLSVPYEEEPPPEEELIDPDYYVEDEDENDLQITFKGSSNEVSFVIRQKSGADDDLSLDLKEVRYKLGEEGKVVKEIYRSLLIARQEDTLMRKLELRFGDQGNGYNPIDPTRGYLEEPIVQTICENIKELHFEYSDGVEWMDSWDSEDIVTRDYAYDLEDEELTEDDVQLSGLPSLVKVALTLTSGVVLETITDIPGSELNILRPRGEGEGFGKLFEDSLALERRGRQRRREDGYRDRGRSRGGRRYVDRESLAFDSRGFGRYGHGNRTRRHSGRSGRSGGYTVTRPPVSRPVGPSYPISRLPGYPPVNETGFHP